MRRHRDYCPVARALDLVGDRWSLLVLRELLFGEARFSDLRRNLPGVSPTLLTERLQALEAHGLVTTRDLRSRQMDESDLLAVVQLVYDAATNPCSWPLVLARMNELTDSEVATFLLVQDFRVGNGSSLWHTVAEPARELRIHGCPPTVRSATRAHVSVAADLDRLAGVAAGRPGLRALLLFGSRARGDAAPTADWDLGYLADASFDAAALVSELARVLGTDRVDLVDLSTASGLLRFRAARDGVVVCGDAAVVERFHIDAASFWCDTEPVLRTAYEAVLERL